MNYTGETSHKFARTVWHSAMLVSRSFLNHYNSIDLSICYLMLNFLPMDRFAPVSRTGLSVVSSSKRKAPNNVVQDMSKSPTTWVGME